MKLIKCTITCLFFVIFFGCESDQKKQFEITKIELPTVEFRVLCSTGTYIRSLVHDFGQALGVGAYMSGLRRTKIGTFNVEDAMQWETLEKEINALLEG